MPFYIQGITNHDVMPMGRLFKEPVVEKTQAIIPEHAIDEKEHHSDSGKYEQQHSAAQAYQAVKQLSQIQSVVVAEQIMSSPVITLPSQATINEALILFRTRQFRHLPIVSSIGMLIGIVSDRDILHYLSGVTETYQPQTPHNSAVQVAELMKTPVLTASRDTDVRYIARLFVERRVGALPIVTDGRLSGVITRSDILTAVMQHFALELWA
tara:strand:- start:32832 stop:33464 length:633 start_codon:yes stop_codon:yes gene_type:complete